MLKYISIILKFFSLGLVIAAGGFWAGAEVDSRPKYRDEQTLIGGTVWTQTIIPIGLIISSIIEEELYVFVHAYFLLAGFLLLFTTGLLLVIGEYKSMHRNRSIPTLPSPVERPTYDKIYLGIGILSFLAGIFTLVDFIVIFMPITPLVIRVLHSGWQILLISHSIHCRHSDKIQQKEIVYEIYLEIPIGNTYWKYPVFTTYQYHKFLSWICFILYATSKTITLLIYVYTTLEFVVLQ